MKKLITVTALALFAALPAAAGGYGFDLPNLTWPDSTRTTVSTSNQTPTVATQPREPKN